MGCNVKAETPQFGSSKAFVTHAALGKGKQMGIWARQRRSLALLVLGAAAGLVARPAAAQARPAESVKLQVGDTAPEFKLQYFDGNDLKEVKLSDYRGKKNVVLAFYIFAFTGG